MNTIFISHSWEESDIYDDFVALLNQVLGPDTWINSSVPRKEAIDLSKVQNEADELQRIEDEIERIRAQIRISGLPEGFCRIIYSPDGKRTEIEGKLSLRRKLKSLEENKTSLLAKNVMSDTAIQWINKYGAHMMAEWPLLSNAIRRRIDSSHLIFLLITPSCLFQPWINYEVSVAESRAIPVIGVKAGGHNARELDLRCTSIFDWDESSIKEVINSSHT